MWAVFVYSGPSAAAPLDAAKPRVDPATEQAFLDYSRNCTCNRRPVVPFFEYEVSGPRLERVDGASTPGPRTRVRVEETPWQSVCSGLNGALCTRKNVKCGSMPEAQFTDDSGKVIAVGNECENKIYYI
jgi:hypothetical protein